MNLDSPFFLTKVECPVCSQINEFENIKAGSYTETGRDTDFCPKGIIWANPEYQNINPLLYFMATCPHCFYTHEFNESFKEWKQSRFFVDNRLSLIREKHKQELRQKDSVINKLGEALDPNGHPFESAVIKLLLGIYDEEITEKPSALDLGRYYLRIVWLYRKEQGKKETVDKVDRLNLRRLEETLKLLRSHFQKDEEEIYDLEASVDTCFHTQKEIVEMKQKNEQLKIKYLNGLSKIQEDLSSLQESLDELLNICAQNQDFSFDSGSEVIGITPRALEGLIPGDEESDLTFAGFLASLKEIWTEVPLDECQAMELALKYYKQNYQKAQKIIAKNQKIQSAYLIAELSRRVGDYQEAESYFKEAKRAGQDFIQSNQDDSNKIALARKIVELATTQGKLNWVEAQSTFKNKEEGFAHYKKSQC
jgi:uncharacterized protein (DUF2225 family)